MLSAAALAPAIDPAASTSLVSITDIAVKDLNVVGNRLVADATVEGTILGSAFSQDVQILIRLDGSPGAQGECDILNLSLGPVSLDLLGLNVNLDNCDGGPITVDISGVEGEGNLLCHVAGLLDGGLNLRQALNEFDLSVEQLETLTSGLTDVLNGVLDELFTANEAGMVAAQQASSVADILHLDVGALDLNLLGLRVPTSDICLDVTAEEGPGNLLGTCSAAWPGCSIGPVRSTTGSATLAAR